MEKFGFVYIWFDRHRRMFYIGCHWGTEDDGYVCSSNRMRDAYRRRPDDFKRRVIHRCYTNRADLLLVEHRWLMLINESDLGRKYYNMTRHLNGHWSTEEERLLYVSKKISASILGKSHSPEHKAKCIAALRRRGENWRTNSSKKTAEMNKTRTYNSESMKRSGTQNAWHGYQWITDGVQQTRISSDSIVPTGWRKGRSDSFKKVMASK